MSVENPVFNLTHIRSMTAISFLEWFMLLFRPLEHTIDYTDGESCKCYYKKLSGKVYIIRFERSKQ